MSDQRATATTRHVAAEVRALRNDQGLSGEGLAAAMRSAGESWTRTTVAKLETGRRQHVTVDELLALSGALDVPVSRLLPPEVKPVDADERIARMVRALTDLRRDLRSRA